MIGKIMCALGIHDWVPESWFTCCNVDTDLVCRRCHLNRTFPS